MYSMACTAVLLLLRLLLLLLLLLGFCCFCCCWAPFAAAAHSCRSSSSHFAVDVREVVAKDLNPTVSNFPGLNAGMAIGGGVLLRWSKKSNTILGGNGRSGHEQGNW
jgi:hypothetical protein